MITLKFEKRGAMALVSHIDLLRHITRAIRRSGLEVKYSEGFSPHMQLNFGVPLPLGTNSVAEYLTINTEQDAKSFLKRYNAVSHEGLRAVCAFEVPNNPNLAAKVAAADYSVEHYGAIEFKKEIENIINLKEYIIDYPSKKAPDGVKNIIPLLYGIRVLEDKLVFCIAAGSNTLRADKLATALAKRFGFECGLHRIWRYNQYVREKLLINVDDYLAEFGQGQHVE